MMMMTSRNNSMSDCRNGGEQEQEGDDALFQFYPCPSYYVQSPSTLSQANSAATATADQCRRNNNSSTTHQGGGYSTGQLHESSSVDNSVSILSDANIPPDGNTSAAGCLITRYNSSSRGSTQYSLFVHDKIKVINNIADYDDEYFEGEGRSRHDETDLENEENAMIARVAGRRHKNHVGFDEKEGDDEDPFYYGRNHYKALDGCCWRYFSFKTSTSSAWFCLQTSWRLMVSLGAALLVFYLVTKPPPPKVSIQVAKIGDFGLGEGVDASGVTTQFLTCNFTLDLFIDNKSKLFGLRIQPPVISVSFSNFPFAMSQGTRLYAQSYGGTLFKLFVGTRNRAMYGAGSGMEDMLQSGKGLPLDLRASFTSSFRVLWSIIKPTFHHHSHCLLVIRSTYNKKHHSQAYSSSCSPTS